MKSRVVLVIASALLVVSLLAGLTACAKAPTSAAKTLPVGFNITLVWPLGIDCQNVVEWDVDKINNAGGLDIGGDRYKIKLIQDDNKMDEAQTKTLAQKEIFQDGCKFILNDLWGLSLLPVVEENKIVLIDTPAELEVLDPKWNWVWNGGVSQTNYVGVIAYIAEKFPDKKTLVVALPDRSDGRAYGTLDEIAAKSCGLDLVEIIYYPPTATDLSSVGTKIKTLNPDLLCAWGGGPQADSMVFKAAYAAGYRGQLFCSTTAPGAVMMGIAGPEAVDGLITIAWATEFEPATTPIAQEYKAYYKDKFGKWDDPEIVMSNIWYVLKGGLQKAGSIDPAKVKAVLDNGVKYDGLPGSGQMISRPDQGNNRTVSTVLGDIPVKQIAGGEVKHIDTISLKDALGFMKKIYGSK